MQNNFLEFGVRENVKLYGIENVQTNLNEVNSADIFGGVFRDGQLGWIAIGAHIEIVSLKNGNKIADYTFGDRRFTNTFITFVTEVKIEQINSSLLAIGVQCSPTTSFIYLFAVDGSRIINAIEIEEKVTSCCFIDSEICADSALHLFDGCIVVGTEAGQVIIIDLFVRNCLRILNGLEFTKNEPKLCKIMASTSPLNSIKAQKLAADDNGFGFGVKLEDLGDSGSVLSLLCLTPLLVIAVGFEDGKMLLYDLCTLDAFHVAHPPEVDSPLEKLAFIEPADDPRACVYVWCFHSNERNAIAVLHSLTYERKTLKSNGGGLIYKNFERCSPRLTMPMFEKSSKPITCQSITKFVAAEDNFITLCLLAWSSSSGAYVCVFDLNQWYKQHMPDTCDWRSSPTFLAIFPLGKQPILDVWMNAITVTPFSSLNRPEEHFYPSSLSFDCAVFTTNSSANLHWLGLQNQALEHLNRSGPCAILEPNRCFAEMVRASLIPQFTDYSYDMSQSLKSKREFLLSIALEYNCIHLLRKCAIAWADGSHLSKQPLDGLSLSTLTEWIWRRAISIKDSCNDMCIPLFDHSGRSIEPRSQKVLLNFSRQLKRLFQLMDMIVTTLHQYIPGQVLDTLQSQRKSIRMATEYQDVLQWLLNMGLLPEVDQSETTFAEYRDSSCDEYQAIPYPYKTLRNYYVIQRRKFGKINPNFIVPKTKSCRILYIDAFIENECNSAILRSEWKKGMGDGLYPPASLQAMLRTLLVPGVDIERKYMLFVYLFMDLSMALRDERHSNVIKNLIKFPAVFKMDPGLIKISQAFWNLDHGEYESAIDEIISPLAQDQNMSIWQRELLIEALILNDVPHLALRALHAPGLPISPSLEIKTLLANDLVADAFQVQRTKHDRQLLFEFYRGCHEQRKWHYLLNLSLNESEEECLGQYLRSIESSLGENIHFLYLLRRSKYLEAITFIDDLQRKKQTRQLDLHTPDTILSTYRLTMLPSTKQFSDLYYSLKDNINVKLNQTAKYPKPLSSRLLQRKFDLLGGVYHQSLLHTEQTDATYWENQQKKMCGLAPSKVPFLRGLRDNSSTIDSFEHQVCYAQPFEGKHKRRLSDSLEELNEAPVTKRYRIDYAKSNINSTLLTSFKEKPNTPMEPLKQLETSIENERNDADDLMETMLSTPVVQKHHDEIKKSYSLADRINTPLSILKGSMRAKSVSSVTSRRSVDSDERSIRFNIPKDDDKFIVTSTPTVPDVFNFGITQRPSIHSTCVPPLESNYYNLEENQPIDINPSHQIDVTRSPGRKRLRSISPDQSNVANCIDVSVQMPRRLSVSLESFDDQQPDTEMEILSKCGVARKSEQLSRISCVEKPLDVDDTQESCPNEVSSSFVHFVPKKRSSIAKTLLKNQPIEVEYESIAQPLPASCDTTVDSQMSESNKTLIQPIERIIPIETEERMDMEIPSTPMLTKTTIDSQMSSVESNKNISPICVTPFAFRKSLLFDSTEVFEISHTHNERTVYESPVLRRRNLFSDKSEYTEPTSTRPVEYTKADENQRDIVTVQIEDSEDSNIIATPEIVETELSEPEQSRQITVNLVTDKTDTPLKSSTPFVSNTIQESFHSSILDGDSFSTSNVTITPTLHPRNILSETELNETSYYRYSTFTEDSIFKKKNLFNDSDVSDKGNHKHLPSFTGGTRKDHSLQVTTTTTTTQKVSREDTFDLNAGGNDDEDDDGSPILVEVTDRSHSVCKVSNSTSPDFNEDNSYDIYEVSSEIDLALRDEEYDVDDYDESDYEDEDEVIDISSGSDDDKEKLGLSTKRNQVEVSQSQNASLLVAKSTVGHEKYEQVDVADDVVESSVTPALLDISKCSEVSFMTASEGSVSGLNIDQQSYQVVESFSEDKTDGSINEQMNVTDVNQLCSTDSEVNNAILGQDKVDIASAQAEENKSDAAEGDLIMVDLQPDIGQTEDIEQTEVVHIPVEVLSDSNQSTFVNSDLNNAIVQSDDILMESHQQSEDVVTSEPNTNKLSTSDTNQNQLIIEQTGDALISKNIFESHTDINNVRLHQNDVTQGEESLKQTDEVLVNCGETLSDENQLKSTDCDSSNAVQDIGEDGGATIETEVKHLGPVSSELDKAILYPDDADITADSVSHTSPALIETLSEKMESESVGCDLNKAVLLSDTHEAILDPNRTAATSTSPIKATTSDQIESLSADIMMDLPEENESHLISSSDLNKARLYEGDRILGDSVLDGIKSTSTGVVEVYSQKTELGGQELILDMDEILESAVHPDEKINMDAAQDEVRQSNQNEMESELPLKRRLRSNSMDIDTEPLPKAISRRRSSSYSTQRSSPVQGSTRRKLISSELESAAKTSVLEPDDPVKSIKKDESSTSTEVEVQKSAIKASKLAAPVTADSTAVIVEKSIDIPPPYALRTRTRSTTEDNDDNVSIASESSTKTTQSKGSTRSTRAQSKIDVNVIADSTEVIAEKLIDIPPPYAFRTHTRRTTEDNDDNVSIASESSTKTTQSKGSTRSTRSTRAQSKIDVDSSTTSKRSRNKPKVLPVIAEDFSNEVEDESQSYSDTRRLTRAQKAVMSKAAGFHNMVAPLSATPKRKRKISGRENDESEDDRESVSSTKTSISAKSNRSKRSRDALTPIRQSKRLQELESHIDKKSTINDESDKESIASTSTTNSTRRRKEAGVSKK